MGMMIACANCSWLSASQAELGEMEWNGMEWNETKRNETKRDETMALTSTTGDTFQANR